MDTRLQNFWKESINKEMTLRFSWQARYANKGSKAQTKPKATASVANNAAVHNSITSKIKRLEAETERMQANGNVVTKTTGNMNTGAAQGSNSTLNSISDMRPASSFTRSLLYNGLSVHGEGRHAYLKRRKTIVPDQKYLYPLLSSTEYGWKILEHTKLERSPHGHASVIRDSFYRNSGIIFQ